MSSRAKSLKSDVKYSKRIFVFAAEASADKIGESLVLEFVKNNCYVSGVGPSLMQKAGQVSVVVSPYDISIIGYFEVIPYLLKIRHCFKQAKEDLSLNHYDIFVSIDIPKLSKPLARIALKKGIPCFHIVSPTIWAWRYDRIWQFKDLFKTIYCLFNFEVKYYKEIGQRAVFIGSPQLEGALKINSKKTLFHEANRNKKQKVIALYPGSRRKEISTLLPLFTKALERIKKETKLDLEISLHGLGHQSKLYQKYLKKSNLEIRVIYEDDVKQKKLNQTDLALTSSGSVTLNLAANKVSQIICYKLGYASQLIYRKLMKIDYSNLINHIANKEIIPELLMEHCNLENIYTLTLSYLTDKTKSQNQIRLSEKYLKKLANPSKLKPGQIAAKDILSEVSLLNKL